MRTRIQQAGKRRFGHWLALSAAICLTMAGGFTKPANALGPNGYVWKNVAVSGANAMLTGIYANPAQSGLFYLKTDVGGIYKWDNINSKWLPLTDFLTLDNRNYYGGEGFAFDPSNVNVLYFAGGEYTTGAAGTIFKSTNQGSSWTQLSATIPMGGNEDRRWAGERLGVSTSGTVVLFGSRTQGLYRSTDSGSTWAQVSTAAIPLSGDNYGVQTVAFDRVTSGKVYVGVSGHGVYKSTDNGATWASIGGSTSPRRLWVGPDGVLWYTNGTSVSKYSGTTWTNYTPGGSVVYCPLAVNPSNANEVTVATQESRTSVIYRTTNGGTSWATVPVSLTPVLPWWNPTSSWTFSNLVYNPFNTSSILADNWTCPNIAASTASFTFMAAGHEEDVILCVKPSTSGIELFNGIADVDGFRMNNGLDAYPSQQLGLVGDWSGYTHSMDAEATNANNMFRVGSHQFYGGSYAATSTDNGVTWNKVTIPANLYTQWCAMSATNASNVVLVCNGSYNTDGTGNSWAPTPATNPWLYTTNAGSTWNVIAGLPTPPSPYGLWVWDDYLKADPINGSIFYYLDAATGTVYRSTNGGANFSAMGTVPATAYSNKQAHHLKVNPYTSGDLWVALDNDSVGNVRGRDSGEGLYHSTNSGTSWTKIAGVTRAWLTCLGKPPTAGANPALYIFGRLTGDTTDYVYRSLDLGATWLNIMDPAITMGDQANTMEGSLQVYGQIYVGTGGRGLYYGAPGAPTIPSPPTGLTATAGNAQVSLSWTASSGATSYNVLRSTVSGSGYASVATGIATTSYTNTGLANGTTYYFVVTATNSAGTSGNSNQASATPSPGSSITFKQVNSNDPVTPQVSGQVISVAYAAQTAGDLNIVVVGWNDTTGTVSSVVDSAGNTYTRAIGPTVGGAQQQSIYYAPNIHAGANTVTVTMSMTVDYPDIRILEYSGVSAVDVSNAGTGNSATSNSNSVTTTTANELIFSANTCNPTTNSGETGFTTEVKTADGDIVEDKIVSATGAYSGTATLNSSGNWVAQIVTFKAAGTPPPAPTGLTGVPGNAQVALAWNSSTGATSYNVLRSTVNGSGYAQVVNQAGTTYTNAGLTNGTQYYFVVQAVSSGGTSGNSNQAAAKPVLAPTFVQVATNDPTTPVTTGQIITVAYAAQTAGNLNVVVVGWNDTTSTVSSVADSAGNTYTLAVGPTTGPNQRQAIYYAKNIKGGANTVTVTMSASVAYPDIRIAEYTGVGALDVTSGANGTSTAANSGSATTTTARELIFTADTCFPKTNSVGSGFTTRLTTADGDIVADESVTATGGYAGSATLNSSGSWVMQMATFK